ncbi:MAG: 4,4'-diaponeurosporenoate glycosyltransferase [Acidimicrobiales bacterium]
MGGIRLAVVGSGWIAGWWLLLGLRGLVPVAPGRRHDRISIIIPARNEAASLPNLLVSLAGSSADEVVVVDDASTDGTADLARASGATVVPAAGLPVGWAGKPWACQTGADFTTHDVLVFVDADVSFAPGGLDAVVATQAEQGGLVSVQPWHRCVRPVESLSAMCNVVALMGVGAFAARTRRPPAGAFGPVMVCSRADYERVGGHASVRAEVIEDVALAQRFLAGGAGVTCLAGGASVAFRMYPLGLAQLIEGWTKNIAVGARRATRPLTLAMIVWWLVSLSSVPIGLLGRADTGVYVGAYLAVAGQLAWMLRRAGRFRWWAWAIWPLPLAVFVMVFARALAFVVLRRPPRWKGRRLPS